MSKLYTQSEVEVLIRQAVEAALSAQPTQLLVPDDGPADDVCENCKNSDNIPTRNIQKGA